MTRARNTISLAERRAAKRKAELETGKVFAMPDHNPLHLYRDGDRWALDHCDRDDDWNARLGTFPTWLDALHAAFDVQERAQAEARAVHA